MAFATGNSLGTPGPGREHPVRQELERRVLTDEVVNPRAYRQAVSGQKPL